MGKNQKKKKRSPKKKDEQPAPDSKELILYESSNDRHAREEEAHQKREEKAQEDKFKRKLDLTMKHEVCLLLAMGHTDKYIAAQIEKKFDIAVHWTTINKLYRHGDKWQSLIRAFKKNYIANIGRHDISKKGWRLRVLQAAIIEAQELGDTKTLSNLLKVAAYEMGNSEKKSEDLPPGGIHAGGDVHYHQTKIFQGVGSKEFEDLAMPDAVRLFTDTLQAQRAKR